jgi:hypothetical protein
MYLYVYYVNFSITMATFDNLDNFANVSTLIIKDLFYFHNVIKSIGFHIIHLNIRSVNKNFSEFLLMITLNYKIENFNVIKTIDNLFNQNNGIIVYINKNI